MKFRIKPLVFLKRKFSAITESIVVNSVRVRNLIGSEEGEPDSLISVLQFNDEKIDVSSPAFVDLNNLVDSMECNGTFFIWTCSCGAPGCAGMFGGVEVSHSIDETIWNDPDTQRRFVIQTAQLRLAINDGIINGTNLIADRPLVEFFPEQNGSIFRESKSAE